MFDYLLFALPFLIVYIAFLNICKCRFSTIKVIILFFAMCIAVISAIIVFDYKFPSIGPGVLSNIFIAGCFVIFGYAKTKSKLLGSFYAILAYTIAMISDHMTGFLVTLFFDVDAFRESLYIYLIITMVIAVMCYVISRYLGNHLRQCYIQLSSFEVKRTFAAYGLVLSSFLFILSHVNMHMFREFEGWLYLPTVNILSIAGTFFVAIFMLGAYALSQQRQIEGAYRNKAQKDLENYTQNLEKAYDDMRSFRHDYLNLLYALVGFSEEKDGTERIKEYLKKNVALAQDALDSLTAATESLRFIHIPELKGLLSVKFAQAQARNIKVELDIGSPIDDIPVNRMDLCRLTGIMVDNAMEELQSEEYTNKVIKFGVIVDGSDILIICSNPCKIAPSIEVLFKKGYSTKGIARGLGLYNLKRICEENGNLLPTVRIDNGEFTLILTIRGV